MDGSNNKIDNNFLKNETIIINDKKNSSIPEETSKNPLIKWGWVRALLFFGSGFLVMLVYRPTRDLFISHEGSGPWEYLFYTRNLKLFFFVISLYLFIKFIDREDFKSLGFHLTKESRKHLVGGLILGIAIPTIILILLSIIGSVNYQGFDFNNSQLYYLIGLMLTIGFFEELVFRFYYLQSLMDSMNKYVALAIISIGFALIHADNLGANVLNILNVFLAGLLLGLYYIHKKNVWFPIAFHFTWNLTEGVIIGSAVSGTKMPSFFQFEFTGSEILTGGTFGFEGSIFATILLLILVIYIQLKYRYDDKN